MWQFSIVEHTLTTQPVISFLGIYSSENLCSYMNMDVYGDFILTKKHKTMEMSFNWLMDRPTVQQEWTTLQ